MAKPRQTCCAIHLLRRVLAQCIVYPSDMSRISLRGFLQLNCSQRFSFGWQW
jgi:hypothetical protein